MSGSRHLIAWLLLGALVVVGAGAAVLGLSQAPSLAQTQEVPLLTAVTNTLTAANYSQVLAESTSQGRQTDHLVFEAPDKLGGYIESGAQRFYVYVIGSYQYQSLTVPSGTPTSHLTFYKQPSQGAAALDPAHGYLPYATQAKHPSRSGDTYSFMLTKQGQTGTFTYTVSGQYISRFTLRVSSGSVRLDISDVGTSPPVALPAGAKVVSAPPSGSAP